ncbi:MAG: DUF4890 domain-containing protein [Bacteroidaceae bacterium]|nr:DUF4890 domain-containing protein [Bacteroidaceae bacterium]
MKKLGLVLFAFLAMSVCTMAQNENRERAPRMNREQMVKSMTENHAKRLNLNAEQTAKMQVLNDSLMSNMMSGFGQRQGGTSYRDMSQEERDAMRKERETKMNAAREKYNKGVKAILTEEQYKEFEKMQKETPQFGQRGQRGQGGNGNFGGGRNR